MKKKNLIMAIASSLYNREFYREVAENWRGRSFVYLLVLIAICWLFASVILTTELSTATINFSSYILPQVPTVKFAGGVASTEADGPFYITYKKAIAIIDTNNQIKNFRDTAAFVLITDKSIVFKQSKNEIRTYYFSKTFDGTVTAKKIQDFLYKHRYFLVTTAFLTIYFGMLIFLYVSYINFALFAGLLGMIYVGLMKNVKLKYSAVLSLAMICLTPVILIRTILLLSPLTVHLSFLPALLIVMVYLFFAVRS